MNYFVCLAVLFTSLLGAAGHHSNRILNRDNTNKMSDALTMSTTANGNGAVASASAADGASAAALAMTRRQQRRRQRRQAAALADLLAKALAAAALAASRPLLMPPAAVAATCAVCGAPTTLRCAGCVVDGVASRSAAWYCSEAHQRLHWTEKHSIDCPSIERHGSAIERLIQRWRRQQCWQKTDEHIWGQFHKVQRKLWAANQPQQFLL